MAIDRLPVNDIVLFPHCDLHVALHGPDGQPFQPRLRLRLKQRNASVAQPGQYSLVQFPAHLYDIDFFAPHNEPRHRFENLPTVARSADDTNYEVTSATPGVYLFQVRALSGSYIVGRLQVHDRIVDWWFGNDSITTAKDPTIGHAQPSVYAKFSDDPTGTDLIGDITGHGYFSLTSSDQSKVVVTADGRLRGVEKTGEPANPNDPADPNRLPTVSGTFLGRTNALPVRVVDYGEGRPDLQVVRGVPTVAQVADRHNILFVPEGFRAADKDLFDKIVEQTTHDMFSKPRHEPYGLLERNFNVFKAFVPSRDNAVTTGFRVTDTDTVTTTPVRVLKAGTPIPYDDRVSANPNVYTLSELIAVVGLPMRNEQRQNLPETWASQDLANLRADKVDAVLVEAWKRQQSVGILHARDTFFGLQIGRRLADRRSGRSNPPVTRPANGDQAGDRDLQRFIARMYEFYGNQEIANRTLLPDSRRHPPELFASLDDTNAALPTFRYIGGLRYLDNPVGQSWAPNDAVFQKDRGLVALIVLDDFHAGTNINNFSVTAQTVNSVGTISVLPRNQDPPQNDQREKRRDPGEIKADFGKVTDTVAHELGHSFNLADEYEDTGGDSSQDANVTVDVAQDNVAIIGFVRDNQTPRGIDPDKVKWLGLPRMLISSRLLADSVPVAGGIRVAVDPTETGQWVLAKLDLPGRVSISTVHFGPAPANQQLGLTPGTNQTVAGLSIVGEVDEASATITLAGPALPNPAPTFQRGSVLYVPQVNSFDVPLLAVEQKVLSHLRSTHRPLNQDRSTDPANNKNDDPESIDGFSAPCKSFRLIGVYEGAGHFGGGRYRPAGACKMRDSSIPGGTFTPDKGGAFCFVCKWLIVNRVDPGMHALLNEKFYPEAKKNEDDD